VRRRASGVFDDCATGWQPAVRCGAFDKRQRHSILHAAGGVRRFQLRDDARCTSGHHSHEFDQRCVTDRRQDAGANLHRHVESVRAEG